MSRGRHTKTMNQLPLELTERVMGLLHPWDRLNCALACSSWAEALCSPPLLDDIWLHIFGFQIEGNEPAILQSQRRYRNIRIIRADLARIHPDFWMRFGGSLRRLTLTSCTIGPNTFFSIFQHCPALDTICLADCLGELGPVNAAQLESVRESLLAVRNLRLEMEVREDFLDLLLTSMPNTRSLTLSPEAPDHPTTFVSAILRASQMFTKLDFSCLSSDLSDQQVIDLVETYSESLLDLRLYCYTFSAAAYPAIGNCTKLQRLSLYAASNFGDNDLRKQVRNSPDLEYLELFSCVALTDASMRLFRDLRKLRRLALFSCNGITNDALCSLSELINLRALNLEYTAFEILSLPRFANLKNLQCLWLSTVIYPETIDVICENFKRIQILELGNCENLTSVDGLKLGTLKCVKRLMLHNCREFTDLAFEQGLGSPEMEYLTVHTSAMTDVGLASLAAHHGRLKHLCLDDCPGITDAGMLTLLPREPYLKCLEIGPTDVLSDRCLTQFEISCPRLRFLRLHISPESAHIADRLIQQRPLVNVELVH